MYQSLLLLTGVYKFFTFIIMDPIIGTWGKFRADAASRILAFSVLDRVSTRADIAQRAKNAGNFRGTTFSPDRTKNAILGSELEGKVFLITDVLGNGNNVEIFIPYLANGTTPNGGGTFTTMNRNLIESVGPPTWADNFEKDESGFLPRLKQMGGRRTTKSKSKSKKSKSKKGKSKKSKKSKSRKSRK
jgi:hypothetical protein